jgi:hypothetical protein
MKLNKGLLFGAAAITMVGGSVAGLGAYSMRQDVDAGETAALEPEVAATTNEANTTSGADVGVEQYRGGGHFGGHAGGHFGGHGWAGRSWGGRGWGWGHGYRRCGWFGYYCY